MLNFHIWKMPELTNLLSFSKRILGLFCAECLRSENGEINRIFEFRGWGIHGWKVLQNGPDFGGVAPQFQARGEAGFRLFLQTSSSVSKRQVWVLTGCRCRKPTPKSSPSEGLVSWSDSQLFLLRMQVLASSALRPARMPESWRRNLPNIQNFSISINLLIYQEILCYQEDLETIIR